MFLERLTITSETVIIRDIPFNLRGLNLIIDETQNVADKKVTGNNVGKTTFLRSIDFCLGSSGTDLYQDKELKTDNELVKSFLTDKKVAFTLSIITLQGDKVVIRRSFQRDLDLFINGTQQRNLTQYKTVLNELFFGIKDGESTLTFRNLIKKFVRSDEFSGNNIFKVLFNITKPNVYRAMYLTLFGFQHHDLIKDQTETKNTIDGLNKKLRIVKGVHSLDELKQKSQILQARIQEKEAEIKTFDLPVTYDTLIKRLNASKQITASLSSEVSALTTKISFNRKTRDELRQSQIHIDPIAVRQLYEEANKLVPTIQKQFEDVLDFHQKMIGNKVNFIDHQIAKLESDRQNKQVALNKELTEQSRILQSLENSGTFDDLIKIRYDLDALLIEKGKLLNQIEQIESLQNEIDEANEFLEELDTKFQNLKDEIKSSTEVFNKYLVPFSELVHGEQLYIYFDSEKDMFDMTNLQGNAGKGYKKSDILVFDLAFINFANEIGVQCPRFAMHDELEVVHHNQIETIFNIANSVDGQLFISVLKDKIDFLGDEYISQYQVLSLSQNDKFFKL